MLLDVLGNESQQKFYFPARCSFEALALINVARWLCRMPPLPSDHRFQASNYIAVRLPEPDEVPVRGSVLTTLVSYRGHCLVRPKLAGRFPEHCWDGPFHRLHGA